MSKKISWNIEQDFAYVQDVIGDDWNLLHEKTLLITGGTGFIGKWLLSTLLEVIKNEHINCHVFVLTRNADKFSLENPQFSNIDAISFIEGDVRSFNLHVDSLDYIIHAATDASAYITEHYPLQMYDTVVAGTRCILEIAKKYKSRVLFLSSGAVYGKQPYAMTHVDESWLGGPDCNTLHSAYAEAKRSAETLCAIYGSSVGVDYSIARIFSILGPFLSLDIHFAAGNFIRDAIRGETVIVNGNGLPIRSYIYITDLVISLWKILLKGRNGIAYNVGSDIGISLGELAEKTAKLLADGKFEILGINNKGWNTGRYVPCINLLKEEFSFNLSCDLDNAIIRTALWNGWKGKNDEAV